MNEKEAINIALEKALENHQDVFLVDWTAQQNHHDIVIDGDILLGIKTVSEISRNVNKELEVLIPDNTLYSLEIGTPGADSPLKLLRQYHKHIGRDFQVNTKEDINFKGKLVEINQDVLKFEVLPEKKKNNKNSTIIDIGFENIKKAQIILSFK